MACPVSCGLAAHVDTKLAIASWAPGDAPEATCVTAPSGRSRCSHGGELREFCRDGGTNEPQVATGEIKRREPHLGSVRCWQLHGALGGLDHGLVGADDASRVGPVDRMTATSPASTHLCGSLQ